MGFVAHQGYGGRQADIALRLYEPERDDPLMAFIGTALPFDPVPYDDEWACKQCGNRKVFRVGYHQSRGGVAPNPLGDGDYACGAETTLRVLGVPNMPRHSYKNHKTGDPMKELLLGPLGDPARHKYRADTLKGWYAEKDWGDGVIPSYAWESKQVEPEVVETREGTCPTNSMNGWTWPRRVEAQQQSAWLAFMSRWNSYLGTGGHGKEETWVRGEEIPTDWLPGPDVVGAVHLHTRINELEQELQNLRSDIMNKLAGSHIVYP